MMTDLAFGDQQPADDESESAKQTVKDASDIRPVPRISIQAFCDRRSWPMP